MEGPDRCYGARSRDRNTSIITFFRPTGEWNLAYEKKGDLILGCVRKSGRFESRWSGKLPRKGT